MSVDNIKLVTLHFRYEKTYHKGLNHNQLQYSELLSSIDQTIENNSQKFTDISLTPIKAVFNLECEIIQQLFKALTELQKLQFLPSLALIHGAHTRLSAWENKMQNREVNMSLFIYLYNIYRKYFPNGTF